MTKHVRPEAIQKRAEKLWEAATKRGLTILQTRVEADGAVVLIHGEPQTEESAQDGAGPNPW